MRFLAFILCVFTAFTAFAEEKRYGSFVLNTDIPDTLFLIGEIKPDDRLEFRKALRNHDIQNIVLASPGGIVWEGLQIAGSIFDNELRTYIPRGGTCASACAYLFFAGTERLADGKLGVHQAYSSNAQKRQSVGATQYATQFTVSEIIGFLNEFGTPAFVYEKMFQDIDMYYFDELELVELNTETFGLENSDKISVTKFISAEIQKQKEKPTPKEIIAIIQTRLKEIGCNPGPSDGIWGRRTQAAAVAFAKKAGLPTSTDKIISEEFIQKLEDAPRHFCSESSMRKANDLISLSDRWDFKVNCHDNKQFTGRLNIRIVNRLANRNEYRVNYNDSLNRSADGSIHQRSNENIQMYLQHRISKKIYIAHVQYRNGILQGNDSDECEITARPSN